MRVSEIFKKLITTLMIIIICSFAIPMKSNAIDSKLAEPLQAFVCFLGDAIENGLQYMFIGDKAVKTKNDAIKLNIKFSVATIVSNKIPAFDINFFKNVESIVINENSQVYKEYTEGYCKIIEEINKDFENSMDLVQGFQDLKDLTEISNYWDYDDVSAAWEKVYPDTTYEDSDLQILMSKDFYTILSGATSGQEGYTEFLTTNADGTKIVNVDYVRQVFAKGETVVHQISLDKGSKSTEKKSTASILKPIVQKWYHAFRNIALVALLSMLVYMGIKIVLSTTAEEKAKYEKLITNWVTALVILFLLHYIMAFSMNIISEITNVLGLNVISESGSDTLMESIRTDAETEAAGNYRMINAIIYLVLVIYNIRFSMVYLTRVLHITFLSIIAPLIAVTYPIDKEKDGKAQAFDFWIKEYIFNVLLQPIHLILYFVIVKMAQDLIEVNAIFALVAIGYIIPAEKLIRQMFNIAKAGKQSSLSGFTGGAIMSSLLSSLSGKSSGSSKGNASGASAGGGTSNSGGNNSGIRMASFDDVYDEEDGNTDIDNDGTTNNSGGSGGSIGRISGGLGAAGNTSGVGGPNTNPSGGNTNVNTSNSGSRIIFSGGTSLNLGGNASNISNLGTNVSAGNVGNLGGSTVIRNANNLSGNVGNVGNIGSLGNLGTSAHLTNLGNLGNMAGSARSNLNNQGQKPKRTIRLANNIRNSAVGRTAKGVGNVISTGAKATFTGKNIRTIASVAAGAAGLTIGAAAGIASGDVSNVVKYGAIGMGAGSGIVNKTTDTVTAAGGAIIDAGKETKDTFQKGYYGDDYEKKVLIPRVKKQNAKDKEIIEK